MTHDTSNTATASLRPMILRSVAAASVALTTIAVVLLLAIGNSGEQTVAVTDLGNSAVASVEAGNDELDEGQTVATTSEDTIQLAAVSPPRLAVAPVVAYAVWVIVRFGIPFLIRYGGNTFNNVFRSQVLRTEACQQLRRVGNRWGWSSYCAHT